MKKQILSVLLLIAISFGANSQRKVNYRIFAGPDFCFYTNVKNFSLSDGTVGFTGGAEAMININPKMYFLTGLNYGNYKQYNTIDSVSPTISDRAVSYKAHSIELPLGLGFNLSKNRPEGLFLNLALINNFTVNSSTLLVTKEVGFGENTSKNIDNSPMGFYNLGGKVEAGYRLELIDNSMTAFSIGVRPMFWNFTGSGPKTTSWSTFATIGFIF